MQKCDVTRTIYCANFKEQLPPANTIRGEQIIQWPSIVLRAWQWPNFSLSRFKLRDSNYTQTQKNHPFRTGTFYDCVRSTKLSNVFESAVSEHSISSELHWLKHAGKCTCDQGHFHSYSCSSSQVVIPNTTASYRITSMHSTKIQCRKKKLRSQSDRNAGCVK